MRAVKSRETASSALFLKRAGMPVEAQDDGKAVNIA
jgi:hypothetical protein